MSRRPFFWLAAPVLMTLIPLGWGACEAPMIDNESGTPRPCDTDCDCYSGENYELGTRCNLEVNLCLCPVKGHGLTPCCKKGAPEDNCDRQCRKAEECADPPGTPEATASSSSGSGSTGGGASDGRCATATDCPGPIDAVCGTATCDNGVCGLAIKAGPIGSQRRGDCHRRDCDVSGKLIDVDDPSDIYNDGKQCTLDTCEGGKPVNKPLMNGFKCPETNEGYCFEGRCEECVDTVPTAMCGPGYVCEGLKYCVPPECAAFNNVKDGPETGVDCGGPCLPCFNPQPCISDTDCFHGVCAGGSCALPSAEDGVKNNSETGIDCGGPDSIPRCSTGERCATGMDCQSSVCWTGECQAPTCKDGTLNGDEAGEDCGGSCPPCK